MPLNEKAALGGAANLETSSQGSLDNLPDKPSLQIPQNAIAAQGQSRAPAAVWGCRSPGCLYLPAPISHASPWAILPTFGTRARSALAGDAGEVEVMSALSSMGAGPRR